MFFQFKTFTTSYYFPQIKKGNEYLYGLYSAYGGKLSKIYWWVFRNSRFVRWMNMIKSDCLPFPFETIQALAGQDCVMSFNMGSLGVEQKISILGYDNRLNQPFFAKFSQKPRAKTLTQNEIRVYRKLTETGLVPRLLGYASENEFVFLKAEYIKGARPKKRELTEQVVDLCLKLKDFHLSEQYHNEDGLYMCLSHGDFCPWNILVDGDYWKLIDWELAADRPLGFDLFTYICQVSVLFSPQTRLIEAVQKKETFIIRFFNACNVSDYRPYLGAFVKEKAKYEKEKNQKGALSVAYNEFLDTLRNEKQQL